MYKAQKYLPDPYLKQQTHAYHCSRIDPQMLSNLARYFSPTRRVHDTNYACNTLVHHGHSTQTCRPNIPPCHCDTTPRKGEIFESNSAAPTHEPRFLWVCILRKFRQPDIFREHFFCHLPKNQYCTIYVPESSIPRVMLELE